MFICICIFIYRPQDVGVSVCFADARLVLRVVEVQMLLCLDVRRGKDNGKNETTYTRVKDRSRTVGKIEKFLRKLGRSWLS